MELAVWIVLGNIWHRRAYEKNLIILISPQEKVLTQLTHRPGMSEAIGMMNKTLMQCNAVRPGF